MKIGTVIRFRERLWRLDQVTEEKFAATPIDGRDSRRRWFLRAFEEENLQEGSLPKPDPETLGEPASQDLLLRAHRLSLIHGSAPFLGLQRSRAIPEPYQLVPLLMALDMSPVRLLIGDDVGIGKTIEAGLIVSELLARGRAERVLVAVPAALREQWQESLSRFFHLDAVVLSGQTRPALERRLLPGESPWEAFPFVVASIDYLKKRIGEVLSHPWDVLLVDEAHVAARPHGGSGRSSLQKQRWEFLEAAASSKKVKHLLLLSATPHPGYTDSFTSLLESLNPECLDESGKIRREAAGRHVVQRRRKDLRDWYGDKTPFPDRSPTDEIIPLGPEEKRLLQALRQYCEKLKSAHGGAPISHFVSLHLQRRALSSPRAIQLSLAERIKKLRRQAREAAGEGPNLAEAEATVTDQDSTSELEDEDRWARMDRAALLGTEEEIEQLEKLRRRARSIKPDQDRKLTWLLDKLPGLLSRHQNAPRVLVFTRYKHTLEYLSEQIQKEAKKKGSRIEGLSVFTIHGEMPLSTRREVFRAFEKAEPAVCVATDCISEGLDLQRACAELVHYELPWNPNRLEQRNGRIDRYGQPEPTVGITTLVREDELDITILEVLIRKAGEIRETFGFCPVVFSSMRDLERLIAKFRPDSQQLLPFDGSPGDAPDPFDEDRIRKIEEESFYGQAEVRLPEVEQALQETYRTVGSPEEIRGFVLSALDRAGAKVKETPGGTLKIDLRPTDLTDLAERLEATFDPRLARDEPQLELLDIAHPLVRRLIEQVREAAAGTQEGRVAARGSREVSQVTGILHVLARYVTASDPPVVMEELIPVLFLPYGGSPPDMDPYSLLRAPAAPVPHTEAELREYCADALAAEGLDGLVEKAVETRRLQLAQRQSSIRKLAGAWAHGMDQVEVASVDWLTLTILVPAHE